MRQKNNENQQNNKDCEIDSRVFNFLVRRLNIEEKIHFSDLRVVTYSFEGYPNYGLCISNPNYWYIVKSITR